MFRILAILFLCVAATAADTGKTTLRKLWASSDYTAKPVPADWLPAKVPATASDVSDFESFSLQTGGLSIAKFIAHYGLPSRYLTTTKDHGQDFLIYDLPSDHAVALYVPKPTSDTFGACVIITSDGSLLRLIK